jgi:hypothetical protein
VGERRTDDHQAGHHRGDDPDPAVEHVPARHQPAGPAYVLGAPDVPDAGTEHDVTGRLVGLGRQQHRRRRRGGVGEHGQVWIANQVGGARDHPAVAQFDPGQLVVLQRVCHEGGRGE